MGETISLKSRHDGFELAAYHATPGDARRGGLVLIQEIFGVTDHIRELCDGFAADGYEVIAPAFYDRLEPGFAADYGPDAIRKGVRYSQATHWDQVAGDLQAAVETLSARGVAFETPPHLIARLPDHELWMAIFRDPDGNLLALMSEGTR